MTTTPTTLLSPGGQRILVMMAHPDDAEFLMGGTIARLAAEGRDIYYLLATRGDKGSEEENMSPERLAGIREEEQRHAAATLGVRDVLFLEHQDGEVEPTLALRREFAAVVRSVKPDVVFTFDPWRRYEIHPDHRAVGRCALDALAASRGSMYFPDQLNATTTAHRVRQIYFFATDQPNHWVDITDYIDKKVQALHCHASQVGNRDIAEQIRQRARLPAIEHGYTFAEAFHHLVMR
ncbi:MAG: PIG-L family deacetylase [Ktedonobacteraceae bacterium]|nr:PIG-L family deacetylase [Ktedonobacteraceae bacterium]